MERMPNISIDRRVLNMLLMQQLRSGGEAIICHSFRPNTLFKIMVDRECQKYCDSFGIPFRLDLIEMSDNKFKKIKRLYEMQLDHSVMPLSTISMDGRLIGYEMTYNPKDKSLAEAKLHREEIINFLSESKDILEYYAKNDITYGDVADRNILVNKKTKTVKFCDMDNISLGQYPIDKMSLELAAYCESCGGLNAQADAYMHNLMSLTELSESSPILGFEPVCKLVQKDYSKNFTDEVKATLTSMEQPQNFNGEYIVQYVKRKR